MFTMRITKRFTKRTIRGEVTIAAAVLAGVSAMLSGGSVSAQTSSTQTTSPATPATTASMAAPGPSGLTSIVATTGTSVSSQSTGSTVVQPTTSDPLASASSVVATEAPTTSSPPTSVPFVAQAILHYGSKGAAVENMERRLDLLKYDIGTVDTRFDAQTAQGLMAFQKVHGLRRTARFDIATQKALQIAVTPGGLIPNGGLPRVEVDITRQVLMYFDKYGLSRVVNVSTGSGKKYCTFSKKSQRQVCGDAKTPRGNFRFQWKYPGDRESDLGHLYNPVYFSGGFAVHGSNSIPGTPASHGCVRVSNHTATWFFKEVALGTPIFLYD